MKPASNSFLIAEPFLNDEHFQRSVILLCSHDADGSMGLALNRPFDHTLDELIDGVKEKNIPVFLGGPVAMDTIHILHQLPELIPESFPIGDNLFWGGNWAALLNGLKQQTIDLKKIRFYLGYSGWSAGQLDEEIKENTWLVSDSNAELIFNVHYNHCWKESLRRVGPPYNEWMHFPNDPHLN